MKRTSANRNKEKKGPKPDKGKGKGKEQQPVKVVYFSNPTKVNTSVHDFRSVVQELTGRDSGEANLAKYGAASNDGSASGELPPPSAVQPPYQTNPGGADRRNESELDTYLVDVTEMLDEFGSSFS